MVKYDLHCLLPKSFPDMCFIISDFGMYKRYELLDRLELWYLKQWKKVFFLDTFCRQTNSSAGYYDFKREALLIWKLKSEKAGDKVDKKYYPKYNNSPIIIITSGWSVGSSWSSHFTRKPGIIIFTISNKNNT